MRPILNTLIPELMVTQDLILSLLGLSTLETMHFPAVTHIPVSQLSILIWVKGNLCKADLFTQVPPDPESGSFKGDKLPL